MEKQVLHTLTLFEKWKNLFETNKSHVDNINRSNRTSKDARKSIKPLNSGSSVGLIADDAKHENILH